jgi:hypothetical protein
VSRRRGAREGEESEQLGLGRAGGGVLGRGGVVGGGSRKMPRGGFS